MFQFLRNVEASGTRMTVWVLTKDMFQFLRNVEASGTRLLCRSTKRSSFNS